MHEHLEFALKGLAIVACSTMSLSMIPGYAWGNHQYIGDGNNCPIQIVGNDNDVICVGPTYIDYPDPSMRPSHLGTDSSASFGGTGLPHLYYEAPPFLPPKTIESDFHEPAPPF